MAQTILVVDDDASIRDAVSFYMRREGYDVLQAKDGQAAMEVIATENFDLAILDIMMEGYNGVRAMLGHSGSKPNRAHHSSFGQTRPHR